MSDAMSDYLEGEIIDHLFRAGTFAKPSAIYVGLIRYYEASKIESLTGTTITTAKELGAGAHTPAGYVRMAVTQNDDNWSAATTGGATSNSSDITFPTSTSDWGHISGVFIVDHLTAGNLLLHGSLTVPRDVKSGDIFKFNAGDLDISFT